MEEPSATARRTAAFQRGDEKRTCSVYVLKSCQIFYRTFTIFASNIAFFSGVLQLRSLLLAAADILIVWGTIIWMVVVIWKHYRWVAVAQVPYFVWVSIATALQLSISWNNWPDTSGTATTG